MSYDHISIENKWNNYWLDKKVFSIDTSKRKHMENFYVLDMFPYPSASGLHVGHPKGYTATDIVARMKRMQGYNVLHPMGWDAFGLPAEQYAIKNNKHPETITKLNIDNFRRQIKDLGFSYDWDKEINTTDSKYYKWTQWIFIKLYNLGLAYIDEIPVNWCPELGTVLANEEVINGLSERGNYPVERRPMKQWVLKITSYAERLLNDLEELDWPESLKEMQRNWIGKSDGAEVYFKIKNLKNNDIKVFTTRPDTLFGVSYIALSPENELVNKVTTEENYSKVAKYCDEAKSKSDLERTDLAKDISGVFTGSKAINPVNGNEVPVYVSEYVLNSYGTGAIMGVPAHDKIDFEFASQLKLPIPSVIKSTNSNSNSNLVLEGEHINSGFLNGLSNKDATEKIINWIEEAGVGNRKTNYKLRDWLFSRQRYWGEPIPIIHWEDGTISTVKEEDLPLTLPSLKNFKPSGTGESPLAKATDWVNVVDPITGKKGKRETNTMPQWAGSCWYYLRFIDPDNNEELANKEKLMKWLPVDTYVGGAEHAVLHLLYARFWHKVLYDIGVVPTKEPFQKLFNQGMMLGDNNEKMSKSKGNVVNPDDIIISHGADCLRLYEMFMGPLGSSVQWSRKGLDGSRRFLDRVWRLVVNNETGELQNNIKVIKQKEISKDFNYTYHITVKKVTEDFEQLRFNTGISQLMVFVNEANKQEVIPKSMIEGFVKMLSPVSPHISEELWSQLGHSKTISFESWPKYDKEMIQNEKLDIIIQVNGKNRSKININSEISRYELEEKAKADTKIQEYLDGKELIKVIVVPKKLVNFVIK